MDEMSFDAGRGVLWACQHGTNPVAIWHVDPATGAATFQWLSATISVGTFRDGLAYDGSDDSLWVSGDVSTTIEHHTAAGVFLGSITPENAAGATLGSISGVSVGIGDLLYLGQNGNVQIVRVRKSDGGFLGSFASPGGARDEGLECDPVNFFPLLALWSREFNSSPPAFMSVIELERGTCACAGQQNTPPQFVHPPTPECGGTLMASVGVNLSFTVTAADIDPGDTVTLSVGGLPAGATMTPPLPAMGNPVSSTFNWTPTNLQVGNHVVTFVAVDGHMRTSSCTITLIVAECHLILGVGPGDTRVTIFGHDYQTQMGWVRQTFPVTMADMPDFPLPAANLGSVGAQQLPISVQVVMYNPEIYPQNPEQWSQRMVLAVVPGRSTKLQGTGTENGIHVTVETFVDKLGRVRMRFPFTIDGM
jgi:hypothetical protein